MNLENVSWTDIVTAIVAVYGAAMATYTFFTQIVEKRTKIKVQISVGLETAGSYVSGPVVFLSASNPGKKAVTLSSFGFLLSDGNKITPANPRTNVNFPHELLPGKACSISDEAGKLAKTLDKNGYSGIVNIIGFYGDQVGKVYKSKKYPFDVNDWLA